MTAPTTDTPPATGRRIGLRAVRVVLMLAVVLGAIGFTASLFYDDEQPRVQANEGITAVAALMDAIPLYREARGRFPDASELDQGMVRQQAHVAGVAFGAGGVLTITYRGRREIDGKTLTLTPYMDAGGKPGWRCDLPDIAPRWWPDFCRTKTGL